MIKDGEHYLLYLNQGYANRLGVESWNSILVSELDKQPSWMKNNLLVGCDKVMHVRVANRCLKSMNFIRNNTPSSIFAIDLEVWDTYDHETLFSRVAADLKR